jgi:hypothetical protein
VAVGDLMVSVADFEERPRANRPTESSRLARGMLTIRGLRVAVTAAVTVGVAVAITSCSSPTPDTQGHPVSVTSAPVTAASAPSATAPSSAATGSMCAFIVGHATSCDSTNPQVQVYANFLDDTTGCSFVRNIDWGDGTTSEDIVVHGGPAGPKFVDNHTYSAPGSYTIFFGGEVTHGDCTIGTPTFHFKLLSS